MRIFEELALLLVDDENGALRPIPHDAMKLAAAGAALIDLEIAGRIDTDLKSIVILDETPLDDDVLDRFLREIVADPANRDIVHWVKKISSRGDDILDAAISNLVRHDILEDPEESGILGLTSAVRRSKQYKTTDGSNRELIDLRIQRVLFSDEVPDVTDAPIICLANACNVFGNLLTEDELEQVRERIDEVSKLSLIGQIVSRAITFGTPETAGKARTDTAPVVKGLPIIGNLLSVTENIAELIAEEYKRLGPVFRVRFVGKKSERLVLTGKEANLFLSGLGQHFVTSREAWKGVVDEFNGNRFLFSMDGPDHVKMRRLMQPHYTVQHATSRIEQSVDVIREGTSRWIKGQPIPGTHAMQALFTAQLISLATEKPYWDYVDDLMHTISVALTAHASKVGKFRLKGKKFIAARQRLEELYDKMMSDHKLSLRKQERNVIDSVLKIHEADNVFLPEVDFKLNVMLPMLAGSDTAGGTLSFMLYHILADPDLHRRVQAEADELFAQEGGPSAEGVRKMDVLPRVMMESMRMHPVTIGLPRRVTTSFDLAGYRIEAGEDVIFAISTPHFLDEYFPDASKFDIDRFTPERSEHKQKGAYVPFGLGRHGCLGGNLANVQVVLTLATVLHDYDLVMDPQSYQLKTFALPLSSPDKRFKFRATRRQH